MNPLLKNNRLVLTLKQKISHYGWALSGIILVSGVHIFHYLSPTKSEFQKTADSGNNQVFTFCFFIFVCLLFFVLKYRSLNFHEVKGVVEKEDILETLQRMYVHHEWHKIWHDDNVYQYEASARFAIPNKLITIIHLDDKILFNGIRTPSFLGRRGESFRTSKLELKAFLTHLNQVRKGEPFAKVKEFNDTQWNWKMILARLFLYPFCAFLIWMDIDYLKNGDFIIPLITFGFVSVYIFSDLYMIFNASSKK